MKTLYKLLIALTMVMLFGACNDEWTDELYKEMVSFKAPLNNEGVSPIYLRYAADGVRDFNLPVIVSGSRSPEKDIVVKIGVDSDTLGVLNYERFQYRTDLFFHQLSEQFYELPSRTLTVPAGANTANFKVRFKFENLDLVEKWVLPLTILEDPSYETNKRKGWRKALLRVFPFNNYSGNYSSTSMNVYFDGDSRAMAVNNRTAWVVDEETVFFYAGVIEETAEDRGRYKIVMQFGEAVEQVDGTFRGNIMLRADDPAINFEVVGTPTYQIRKTPDAVLPYLVREYCTINMQYKYNDITSIPTFPIRYRAQGSMTMERQRNTLIPDEDQAIQW